MMASVSAVWVNSKLLIANQWFPDEERALAVTLMSVIPNIGQTFSFIVTSIAFSDVGSVTVGVDADE